MFSALFCLCSSHCCTETVQQYGGPILVQIQYGADSNKSFCHQWLHFEQFSVASKFSHVNNNTLHLKNVLGNHKLNRKYILINDLHDKW